jgi:hypothetical protein
LPFGAPFLQCDKFRTLAPSPTPVHPGTSIFLS